MKKRFFLSTIVLALLCSFAFVSCSKDDDKDSKGKNDPSKLVVTGAVAEKADTWATVEGYVNNTDGDGNITVDVSEYGIEYNEEGSEAATKKAGKGLADNEFSVKLEKLTPSTTYQYRAYVNIGTKSAPDYQYGKYKTFKTEKKSEESSDPNVLDISKGEVTSNGVYFDGLYYTFDGNKATVTKADEDITSVALTLKVKHDGNIYDLTSIGDQAFAGCKQLTSVKLTYAINSIGKSAFRACSSLETIELPAGLKEIKAYTFDSCSKLKKVSFPTSLQKIGDYAFDDSGLTELSMPSSVTEIGKCCFGDCNFEYIVLSSNLQEIPEKAFVNCYKLKSVSIPSSVKKLGHGAFMYCYLLGEVNLPESLEEIGEYCFQDAHALTYIFIPKGVKTIGGAAFQRCNNLSKVTISYGIKSIDSYAFYDTPKNITMQITASTPPTLGTKVFQEINTYDNQRTLMVPASYLSAYNNATWKAYFRTIKASN